MQKLPDPEVKEFYERHFKGMKKKIPGPIQKEDTEKYKYVPNKNHKYCRGTGEIIRTWPTGKPGEYLKKKDRCYCVEKILIE